MWSLSSDAREHGLDGGDELLELGLGISLRLLLLGLREQGSLEHSDLLRFELTTLVQVDKGEQGRLYVLGYRRFLTLAIGVGVEEVCEEVLESIILDVLVLIKVIC